MNIKRAALAAIAVYVISFALGIGVMAALGVDPANLANIPDEAYYANIAIAVVLAALFTHFYFRGKDAKPSGKEGFLFGIVLIIVGFVLDLAVFLASGSGQAIIAFYSNPLFWIAALLLLLTATAVGALKGRKPSLHPEQKTLHEVQKEEKKEEKESA